MTQSFGPDVADRIRQSFAAQSMMATLGATIDSLGEGAVTIRAPIGPSVLQQQGFAHAGLTFAIGDSAAGYAALTLLPLDQEVVTAEMKINLMAPGRGTHLEAEGRVIRPGRRLYVVTANVYAVEGADRRHVALLTGTMVPVPRG